MITLRDKATGVQIGTLSDEELAFLVQSLEEESVTDQDYYINSATIDLLETDGAPASILEMLRGALQGREGIDVVWSRD